jgi:hypothetical protein
MLDQLTVESFAPLVGSSFWVEFPNGHKVELRLQRAARVMESVAATLPRHPFSLFFIGPASFPLQQATYHVTHESREPMDIFLVPVGKPGNVFEYEAVFT